MDDKVIQSLSKAKIKRAESANLKGNATNKIYRRLIVKCSEWRSPHEHIKNKQFVSKCPPAFSLNRYKQ